LKRFIICTSLFLSSSLAYAASFDCAKASTTIEKAICSDKQLSVLDSDLMTAYKAAQSNSEDPEKIKGEQKTWLQSSRNKCGDVECIRKAYIDRITALRPTAIKATEPEPKEVQATTQNEKPTESNPVENTEAPPQQAAQPVETPPPELPKVVDQTPTPQKVESTNEEPSSPIADVLFGAAGLIAIALIVGLIKPKWVIRWSDKPSRLKVLGYLIPLLLVVSFAAPISRTKSRTEYDMKVAAESKAKAKVEAEEKAQRQEQAIAQRSVSANQSNTVTSQRSDASSLDMNPSAVKYRNAVGHLLGSIKKVAQTRAYNDEYSPCRQMVDSARSTFDGDITPSLVQVQRTRDQGLIYGNMDHYAMILDGLSSQVSALCPQ
jgi:uncharacterized protein